MYEVAEAAHNRPSLPPCVWLPQARFLSLRFLYFVWNILRGDYKRYVFVCVVSHLDWVGSCGRCVGWDLSRLLCTFIYMYQWTDDFPPFLFKKRCVYMLLFIYISSNLCFGVWLLSQSQKIRYLSTISSLSFCCVFRLITCVIK